MKTIRKSTVILLLICAPLSASSYEVAAFGHSTSSMPGTTVVYPSGDESGHSDHFNIQSALESTEPGGTVILAPGHFFTNAGIVVEGFNGTFQGSTRGNKRLTTVEAVAPFHFTHETGYLPGNTVLPSLIFFEFPEEEIAVIDLILQARELQYVEPRAQFGTALSHYIADFGGDVDVTFKNIKMVAGVGDYKGSNVVTGIHSMRGPGCSEPCVRDLNPDLHGSGNAIFRNIESIAVKDYSILPMWYRDGSVEISDTRSQAAIGPWGMINVDVKISDVIANDSWRAIWLGWVSGGSVKIRGLWASGGLCPAIQLGRTENVELRDSLIEDCNGLNRWWASAILLGVGNRDTRIMDNVFDQVIDAPAAIGVLSSRGNADILIRDNSYGPQSFTGPPGAWAIILGGDDSQVDEPHLTQNQVLDVGSNNILNLGGD